jgi:hypothetical protein
MQSLNEPRTEYGQRLAARQSERDQLAQQEGRVANGRLLVFFVGAATGLAAFWGGVISGWWLAPVVAVFMGLMVTHDRTLRRLRRVELAIAFYERGLARIDGHWAGHGTPGDDVAPKDHPYATDLDLFGHGSLFELLCTARTRAGEQALATWLSEAAEPVVIRARQEAVEELRLMLDLREDLAFHGADVKQSLHKNVLTEWAEGSPLFQSQGLWVSSAIMAALGVAGLLVWIASGLLAPLMIVAMVELLTIVFVRRALAESAGAVEEPSRELEVLAGVLARFEEESFQCAPLRAIHDRLTETGVRASHSVARLDRLVYLMEAPRNAFFAPIAVALMWPVHVAFAVEKWRARWGKDVRRWVEAVGELEALCALAGYAYEHPDAAIPEIVEEWPLIEGKGLGHPLIDASLLVRNDVHLTKEQPLLMISGSNMSGKSTLLRTVGVNAVLALAGGRVCAEALRISPMALGASLRTMDSIQEGTSRFYAEILRLKGLTDIAQGSLPLLFLLDELLHGTNSHDRRIGAAAIIKGYLNHGAMGLVTSHDLALTEMASELGSRAANMHFEDSLENSQLIFDYTLRPGVVKKSNALELMRAVGLDVKDGE